ncbi:unnamed protein product [Nezara viridula]|uniref:Mediator of RNA polymerase II transcription subunit 15 n=1 Tax=Nezara viridula TaxID=85310 RepID=A0A9P0E831_NEZVI|nr:unnamed protein product [Nezara viridula]
MSADENNWRTPQFRQSVVAKIDEAIQRSGMSTIKKGNEMENHVFQKAKTKEEYLGFVARLILHMRELNQKKAGGAMPGTGGVQDPINALQNLARQGTGNQMLGGLPPPVLGPQQTAAPPNPLLQNMNARPVLQQKLQPSMQPAPVMIGGGSPLVPRKTEPGAYRPPFMRQSPTPPQSSPVSLAPQSGMVSSPAVALAPSPGGIGASLRASLASSPQLNTPGQQPAVSPCTVHEEVAYREKIRHLSKYIDPLRRMIARVGNDDLEKVSKMKSLLDILTNGKRMPLETLLKCEIVLEKVDLIKRSDMGGAREQHPLIEALRNHLQSPVINHTLQRTFGPCIEALFGSDIRSNVPPIKRKRTEEFPDDIPEVLQGEIARLDQRFKVSLDGRVSGGVQLVCWLDDKHLPCVPPISLSVPEDYPATPPRCHLSEASATPFLTRLESALASRISKLPAKFTISQLLDTWEMSVRQACAPLPPAPSSTTPSSILLGL